MLKPFLAAFAVLAMAAPSLAAPMAYDFDFAAAGVGDDFTATTVKTIDSSTPTGATLVGTKTSTGNGFIYTGAQPQLYLESGGDELTADVTVEVGGMGYTFEVTQFDNLLLAAGDTMVGMLGNTVVWSLADGQDGAPTTAGIAGEIDRIAWTVPANAEPFGHVIRTGMDLRTINALIPEPTSLALFGLGGLTLLVNRRQ